MTHEEFKKICLREYAKIERMVKTVKALNVDNVSCDVYADGRISFYIREKDRSSHATRPSPSPSVASVHVFVLASTRPFPKQTLTPPKTTCPSPDTKKSAVMPET